MLLAPQAEKSQAVFAIAQVFSTERLDEFIQALPAQWGLSALDSVKYVIIDKFILYISFLGQELSPQTNPQQLCQGLCC